MVESTQQVVIASPTLENNQALGSRIEETVQMSSYQIKKALEAKRTVLMTEYNDLKETEIILQRNTTPINIRLIACMQNYLEEKTLPIINLIDDFMEIGESGTFFDDNRDEDVPFDAIAKAIITVDNDINYWGLSNIDTENDTVTTVYMHGSINIFGSIQDSTYHFDEEGCVFAPMTTCHKFDLTADEIIHLEIVRATAKSRERANHEVNDLDTKLKGMDDLKEDIRYAMLTKKNQANGDTAVIDIATQIAKAFIEGIDPSVALLEN